MIAPFRRLLSVVLFVILGMLLLPHLSSAQGVVSNDPNFTPSLLKGGLSFPDGVVFRPPTGDLLVTQSGNNQISSVNPNSGMIHSFAVTSASPDKVAVRSSDGLVAVMTGAFGPVAFFSSTGISQGTSDLGAAIIAAFPGSFPEGATVACLGGLSFDTTGNLFVAAGPGSTESNGCLLDSTWAVYKFAFPTPPTALPAPSRVVTFPGSVVIQDMAFTAARPTAGTLYAIDSEGGNVFEIVLGCSDCSIFATSIAIIPIFLNPRGIAVDPFSGDVYVSEFDGTELLKIPARGAPSDPSPVTFATGFSGNTLRLAFDTNGNLYVNEIGAGNLWKFTRAANATALQPLTQGKVNTLFFTNPNPAMNDQKQTIMIPASANLNGAAFLQDIFVSVDPNTLNTTLENGTFGDTAFFGGSPVAPGTTCALVPSAASTQPNCVVVIQLCFDANQIPFAICPIQEPTSSPDLIQLTFTFTGQPLHGAFLIGFDNGDGQDITDITIADPGGGTKGLCSRTLVANLPAGSVDFSLAVAADPVDLTTSNSFLTTVTVTSLTNFASNIALSLSDVPAGFSASLNPTSVALPAGGNVQSGLTVKIATAATTSGIVNTVGNLLAAGCIDNPGVGNALTSKVSAAQMDIASGQIRPAINVLMAFENEVQAQSGKHIAASCTTIFPLIVVGTAATNGEMRFGSTNIKFSPATVLTSEVAGLIASLKVSVSWADPITGFVVDSTGAGVPGVSVNILPVGSAATTDATGFYFFATTGSLSVGSSYTVQVTVPLVFNSVSPTNSPFTWTGKGLVFNFTLH
jgi:sugar lactone lactonase YvrE